jgi:hypothetical protein
MPYDDCQSFFNVFTQISPAEETFGWKILVANQHFGGAVGNSCVNWNRTLKYPPAYGVCSGPSTIPVRSSIFSSLVTTRMPSGGLFFNSVISRIKRRMVAGVRDMVEQTEFR